MPSSRSSSSSRAALHATQKHTSLSFLPIVHNPLKIQKPAASRVLPNSMAKGMNLKSLLMPKEMWVCHHPKTESFRAAVDIYRSINSVYIDSDGNDTISELGNWFETDSSAASTSEISSSNDSGDMPELALEDLVRGLSSERFFFEPDCTKSISDEGKEKGSVALPSAKMGSGRKKGKEGGLSPFNENKNVGRGLNREKGERKALFKENKKVGGAAAREINGRLAENKTKEISGPVLTLREHLMVDSEKDEKQLPTLKLEDGTVGSTGCEREKEDGVLMFEETEKMGSVPQKEKDGGFQGVEENAGVLPFKESLMMVLDSEDPYMDFRLSMEEMVEAYDLRDWGCLEEMLVWYLRVNGKSAHGYIVGAFVDLLLSLVSPPSSCEIHEDDLESSEDCEHCL
ncbi:Transcription repressor [Nymphaea thermarum]|nr:Transcription repressor [Nymphaea thermarum]